LALGSSYPETGGKNQSAIHWDMIKDLRLGGEIYIDGEIFQKEGKFVDIDI
jgi:aminopeptidase